MKILKTIILLASFSLQVFAMEDELEVGDKNDLEKILKTDLGITNLPSEDEINKGLSILDKISINGFNYTFTEIQNNRSELQSIIFSKAEKYDSNNKEKLKNYLNIVSRYFFLFQREKTGECDYRESGFTSTNNTLINNVENKEKYKNKLSNKDHNITNSMLNIFLDRINFQQFNISGHALYQEKFSSFLYSLELQELDEKKIDQHIALLLKTIDFKDEDLSDDAQNNKDLIDRKISVFLDQNNNVDIIGKYLSQQFSEFEQERLKKVLSDELILKLKNELPLGDILSIAISTSAKYISEYFDKNKKLLGKYNLSQKNQQEMTINDLFNRNKLSILCPSTDSLNNFNEKDLTKIEKNNFEVFIIDTFKKEKPFYPSIIETSHGLEVKKLLEQYGMGINDLEKKITHMDLSENNIGIYLLQIIKAAKENPNNKYFINLSCHLDNDKKFYASIENLLNLNNVILCWSLSNQKQKDGISIKFEKTNQILALEYFYKKKQIEQLKGRLYLVGNISPNLSLQAGKDKKSVIISEEIISQYLEDAEDPFKKALKDLIIFAVGSDGKYFDGTSGATPKVLGTLLQGAIRKNYNADNWQKELYNDFKASARNHGFQFNLEKDKLTTDFKQLTNSIVGMGVLDFQNFINKINNKQTSAHPLQPKTTKEWIDFIGKTDTNNFLTQIVSKCANEVLNNLENFSNDDYKSFIDLFSSKKIDVPLIYDLNKAYIEKNLDEYLEKFLKEDYLNNPHYYDWNFNNDRYQRDILLCYYDYTDNQKREKHKILQISERQKEKLEKFKKIHNRRINLYTMFSKHSPLAYKSSFTKEEGDIIESTIEKNTKNRRSKSLEKLNLKKEKIILKIAEIKNKKLETIEAIRQARISLYDKLMLN